MSTDEKPKTELTHTIPDEAATATAGALAGLIAAGPVGAAFVVGATVGAQVAMSLVRDASKRRAARRAEAFEIEIAVAATAASPEYLAQLAASEDFAEVVFQNYRRAIDALDPAVIPALARLTWTYADRPRDAFFRGWGRVLEDLTAEEFTALRELLSAVEQFGASCEALLWTTHQRRIEMRLKPLHKEDRVLGYVPNPGVQRVLALIEAHNLTHQPEPHGTDLAMIGATELDLETCRRALPIVEPIEVSVFPAAFDRPPEHE